MSESYWRGFAAEQIDMWASRRDGRIIALAGVFQPPGRCIAMDAPCLDHDARLWQRVVYFANQQHVAELLSEHTASEVLDTRDFCLM